jgi:hypothetical protein
MKPFILLLAVFFADVAVRAQTTTATTEQRLERIAERSENGISAEEYLDDLARLRRHPLGINRATAEDWLAFRVLSTLQIENLIRYREALGDLVSLYELQAVPGWDVALIRELLPYLVVTEAIDGRALRERLRGGEHVLLIRETRQWEGGRPVLVPNAVGGPDHLLLRYRYQYKSDLRYGLTAEKDAGETFARGGFDFYSAHLFARRVGPLDAVALGDFTVNLGQGLIQWQSLAFKKSGDVTAIRRQGSVLQPYGSSGEAGFERGIGATLRRGCLQATLFASRRKRDGNLVMDSVESGQVSSLPISGLHRTPAEIADRKAVIQATAGGNLRLALRRGQIGFNIVAGRLSKSLEPGPEPYHRFDLRGSHWLNAGMDYAYTRGNLHLFGEAALDREGDLAFLNGMLLSVDPRLDVALLVRRIATGYRAVAGEAFTESGTPANESGQYVGVAFRPSAAWRIEGFVDVFASEGVRFRVNGPMRGADCLLQATFQPSRGTEIYARYRVEGKDGNGDGPSPVHEVVSHVRQNGRLQIVRPLSPVVGIKLRTELTWYDKRKEGAEAGFLSFLEADVHPAGRFSGNIRLQYFETGGFDSRLYVYESDVRSAGLIPSFSGTGFRYYMNLAADLTRQLSVEIRVARTEMASGGSGAGGNNVESGKSRTELKIQAYYAFQRF